ncbi:MAG: response regulator [Spirochaetota bacterium]
MIESMEYVEELLMELLSDREIDVYARATPEEGGALRVESSVGITPVTAERLLHESTVVELLDEAVDAASIVVRSDNSDDALSREYGVRTLAVVPLSRGDGRAAYLLFGSSSRHTIDPADRARLQQISRLLAEHTIEREQRIRQLRSLVIRLTEAETRERSRIAELLHDDLQQTLAGAKVHIDMAIRRTDPNDYLGKRLATAAMLLEEGIERSRTLSHELNPPMLGQRGFVDALRSLALQIERTYRLRVRVEAPTAPVVLSEFAKLVTYRAVQELLFNVVKHAAVDEARLEVVASDEGVSVTIRDSGAGFDVEGVLREESPNGLGLISIRERLESIGGVLQVESLPGAGSVFTVFLSPEAMLAEGFLTGRQQPASEAQDERKISVVLVDDHAVIRQGIALLLNEEADLEVVGEAESGQAALELVEQIRPDVVVMDLTMPGMPGDEATREILTRVPRTRVIGLSMHSEREAEERMRAAGAAAYLPKAGPSADLIAAIRDAG